MTHLTRFESASVTDSGYDLIIFTVPSITGIPDFYLYHWCKEGTLVVLLGVLRMFIGAFFFNLETIKEAPFEFIY